jgi:hypothetical protein
MVATRTLELPPHQFLGGLDVLLAVWAGEFEFFHGTVFFISVCETSAKKGSKTFHAFIDTFPSGIPHVWADG